jgi:5-methylcytosine-specific restriction enzyme subunit McrC
MQSRVIELREEQTLRLSAGAISDAELTEISRGGKFDVEYPAAPNGHTLGIKSRGTVGHVPVGPALLLRVLPKVPVTNLFGMLEVAYDLKSFRLFDGETSVDTIDDVYERIVSILCQRVIDRARRGLFRDYLESNGEFSFLRGKIDPVATLLNVKRGIPLISCSFDEQTEDLDDNRILLWTLRQVRRPALHQTKIKRELDLARRTLEGAVSHAEFSWRDCVSRFYHRLNDDYRVMHGLCRFILEQSGPDILEGDRTFVPFEVNMPRLFETFVGRWLQLHAPPDISVDYKRSFKLDAAGQLTMEVDIVLLDKGTRQPLVVLDTKYKAHELPSNADIYQITYYARELDVNNAVLVYPAPPGKEFTMMHAGNVRVTSAAFDIGAPLDQAGTSFLAAILNRGA